MWRSNGTVGGTFLVKDIRPGPGSSNPTGLANAKGVAFFSANDGTNGYELWRSTGATANTLLVKNINAGGASSNPTGITNIKGNVFFAANNGTNGIEIWKSNGNGSATGTFLVKDIRPGALGSDPASLFNLNGLLVFAANDGASGVELWTLKNPVASPIPPSFMPPPGSPNGPTAKKPPVLTPSTMLIGLQTPSVNVARSLGVRLQFPAQFPAQFPQAAMPQSELPLANSMRESKHIRITAKKSSSHDPSSGLVDSETITQNALAIDAVFEQFGKEWPVQGTALSQWFDPD